jgi:peptide/nickel transport system substrate-binding protein
MKLRWNLLTVSLLSLMMFITACGTSNTNVSPSNNNNAEQAATPTNSTSASPEAVNEDRGGGTLEYGLANDVDGLDPHATVSASTFLVTDNVFETLIAVTSSGELVPQLATEWTSSEDQLTWTFKLRSDVKFHEGTALSAEVVIESFQRLKAETSPRAGDYANIVEITKSNDAEIVMKLDKVDATFISTLANPWAAIVLDRAGELYGTGPFKLASYEPQQFIKLAKNESYYEEGKPYLDAAKFTIIPNETTLIAGLQAESIHVGTISGAQLAQIQNVSHLKTQGSVQNSIQLMAFNTTVEPLNNVKVRQAMSKAVNKKEIIDGVSWGYGTVMGSHLPHLSSYYVDTNDVLPFDIEAAKALLTEAGYPDGFTVKMRLPEGYTAHINAGQIIADQLGKIGIKVEIEIVEWGIWLSDVYAGRNYELTVISHTGRLDPHAFLSRYHSTSSENYFNYVNSEVDKAIEEGALNSNLSERQALYTFIQKTLAKEVPAVYLQSMENILALHQSVQNLESFPIGIIHLKNVYLSE